MFLPQKFRRNGRVGNTLVAQLWNLCFSNCNPSLGPPPLVGQRKQKNISCTSLSKEAILMYDQNSFIMYPSLYFFLHNIR